MISKLFAKLVIFSKRGSVMVSHAARERVFLRLNSRLTPGLLIYRNANKIEWGFTKTSAVPV